MHLCAIGQNGMAWQDQRFLTQYEMSVFVQSEKERKVWKEEPSLETKEVCPPRQQWCHRLLDKGLAHFLTVIIITAWADTTTIKQVAIIITAIIIDWSRRTLQPKRAKGVAAEAIIAFILSQWRVSGITSASVIVAIKTANKNVIIIFQLWFVFKGCQTLICFTFGMDITEQRPVWAKLKDEPRRPFQKVEYEISREARQQYCVRDTDAHRGGGSVKP